VYPVLVRFGDFEITSFGVLVAAAFLVAGAVLRAELRRRGEDPELAWSVVSWAIIGGLLGGKLYYMLLYWSDTAANPWGALVARGGLVWYGGFGGAALAVWLLLRRARVSVPTFADALAPALALGYAVGRVGCFMVGDDYGAPTDLPWGVKFAQGPTPSTAATLRESFATRVPAGIPGDTVLAVHPTQLYETALMGLAFLLLWRLRKRPWAAGSLFALYLVLAGIERFAVEFLRAKDDRLLGPFTLAQGISVAVCALGLVLLARLRSRPPA